MKQELTLENICKKSDHRIEDKLLTGFDRLERKAEPAIAELLEIEMALYTQSPEYKHVGEYMTEMYNRTLVKYYNKKRI